MIRRSIAVLVGIVVLSLFGCASASKPRVAAIPTPQAEHLTNNITDSSGPKLEDFEIRGIIRSSGLMIGPDPFPKGVSYEVVKVLRREGRSDHLQIRITSGPEMGELWHCSPSPECKSVEGCSEVDTRLCFSGSGECVCQLPGK